jgi:two-component system, OmpR family, sensor histidine kinase VicK
MDDQDIGQMKSTRHAIRSREENTVRRLDDWSDMKRSYSTFPASGMNEASKKDSAFLEEFSDPRRPPEQIKEQQEPRSVLAPVDKHNVVDSAHYEEKTEVIYGEENVIKFALQALSSVNRTLDLCGDRYGASIIVANEPIRQKYIELYERGVRQRHIIEITKENIMHCKKLMQFQELRHLDGLKGYLSILDGKVLGSHAYSQEHGLPHAVASTVRVFVEQQQYFFETLWNKAIPARQRIKELEEGVKREFVETIRDPSEIQKISFDLIKEAEEEILMLFSTADAFRRQEKAGIVELIKHAAAASRNVKIRILISTADNNNDRMAVASTTTAETMTNETIRQLKELGIDVRRNVQQPQQKQKQQQQDFLRNNLTLLIVDQSFSLTVELNDDTKKETSEDEALALATYSNSDPTVFAYTSIFENLWMRAEV